MTRSAMHRGLLLTTTGGILLLATACSGSDSSGISAGDSLLYVTTHQKPKPQRGDEKPAHVTNYDSLGGPYSKGVPDPSPRAQTREAPVLLTPGVSDSVLAVYLDSLSFDVARDNGELARVRCPSGSPPSCAALLYIQPEVGMKKRAAGDIPATGMVVARIINYSATETDSTYHIPPLSRAYWYVDKPLAGPRSRVFMRTPLAATKLTFLGPTRTYEPCAHTPYGGPAVARFRKCGTYETTMTRGDAVYASGSNPFVRLVSFDPKSPSPSPLPTAADVALTDTELWVKCAQGCCIAGP